MLPAPLLVITDRMQSPRDLPHQVSRLLVGGCRWLLLRDTDLPHDERMDLAMCLRAACHAVDAALYISHDAELANAIGADGLHLSAGQSMRFARQQFRGAIGQSCHNRDEARQAVQEGAAYITLSPIYPSLSKPGYGPALGEEGLAAVTSVIAAPVLALGGVTPGNLPVCRAAGAAGAAIMGAAMRADDATALLDGYLECWETERRVA